LLTVFVGLVNRAETIANALWRGLEHV